MKRSRYVGAGILLLAVTLLVLEGLLRLLPIGRVTFRSAQLACSYSRITTIHPEWGTARKPGVRIVLDYTGSEKGPVCIRVETIPIPGYEEYGIRDDGFDPESTTTWVVFGDSFTWGATVEQEEIWCEQIEQGNPGLDMLILASCGTGAAKAADQYRVLRDKVPPHDGVIYQLWLGNEFLDNFAHAQERPRLKARARAYPASTARACLLSASKLLCLTLKATDVLAYKLGRNEERGRYVGEAAGIWNDDYGQFMLRPRNPILLRYCEHEYADPRIEAGIEETGRAIGELRALAGERPVVVVLFPFKAQVYPDVVGQHRDDLDLEKPNRIVRELCRKHDVICLDILEDMRREPGEKPFWDVDHHFTPEGQARAARMVEEHMRERGLLPVGALDRTEDPGMKVAIDVSSVLLTSAGTTTYIRELLAAMRRNPNAEGVTEIAYAPRFDRSRRWLRKLDAVYRDLLWTNFRLPRLAARIGADLLHAPVPLAPASTRMPTVVTVPDMYVFRNPSAFPAWYGGLLRRTMPRALRSARRVLSISEFTKTEILSLLPDLPAENVVVTHLGVNPIFQPATEKAKRAAKEKYDLKKPFILCVATREPRKNLNRLVEAFAKAQEDLGHELVLVGSRGWKTPELDRLIKSHGLAARVKHLGFVDLDDLPALYSLADVFAYPSLYEGFGLPVIEAMACGCPVVTSAGSSLAEVAGAAARLVDPMDTDSIATGMEELLSDRDAHADYARRGLKRAAGFTWDACAQKTVQAYADAINTPGGSI